MNTIGVIPARWASSRFEGKVLAKIGNKTLIQHVWENAKQSKLLDDLIIAADNERVVDEVKKFGGKVCFTSKDQPSGTDRVAEVVNPLDVKIIVNIQGDEPMVKGIMIDNLISSLTDEDETAEMATLVKRIEDSREISDPNVVKVVVDKKGYALYFSRSPIPYDRRWTVDEGQSITNPSVEFYKHIGLYAYTKDFLFTYTNLPPSKLEKAEKLEQLRALEHGFKIRTVETEFDTVGIDTPEDLEKIKNLLAEG